MKKILKKGLVIVSIYLIAVATTLLISNRMEELDSHNASDNSSLTIISSEG